MVMGRNAYLGSPADIHRINDFNFDQTQDRGPVTGLAVGAADLVMVDIVSDGEVRPRVRVDGPVAPVHAGRLLCYRRHRPRPPGGLWL